MKISSHATTRAQSAEKVARGWRSGTHNVMKGLCEHMLESHHAVRASRTWSFTIFNLGLGALFPRLWSTAPATKMSLRHLKFCACPKWWPCTKTNMTSVSQNERLSSLSKHRLNSPNITLATKDDLRKRLSFRSTPATRMTKCPMSCNCHANRRSGPQNVPKG